MKKYHIKTIDLRNTHFDCSFLVSIVFCSHLNTNTNQKMSIYPVTLSSMKIVMFYFKRALLVNQRRNYYNSILYIVIFSSLFIRLSFVKLHPLIIALLHVY